MTTTTEHAVLAKDLRECADNQPASRHSVRQRGAATVVLTSGTLKRFNGGTKIYTLWAKLLRKNGVDALIATQDGSYDEWLVNPEPVVSYADVEALQRKGAYVRVLTSWLDTPALEQLVGAGQFYYFDAELKWTLHFRDKLDYYLKKNQIARIGTHSRYIQSWYMANYGIRPILINEWSDESVFYEEPDRRIAGRIGCMPDASPEDQKAFDFLADKVRQYGRGAKLMSISGDERQVADLLRTVDIFVGLNPGKHPLWGEGCPRTQQEALHCGCALAAFDCLGNREYLYDNWTGLMAPSGDLDGLWKAVKSLLENPSLKERLRANGKSIAQGVFSERSKYELVKSFLGLGTDVKAKPTEWITKEELSSIFPRPFWLAEEEVPYLAQKAAEARSIIVEIGCAYGGSTTVFLLNKGEGAAVYSIDPFVADSKGGVQADANECRLAVAQALSAERRDDALDDWHLIVGYSHDAVQSWNKRIDLLFIDGSHHYEDVRRDFQEWSRFLAADGQVLIHDSRKDNIAEDPSDEKFSRGWMGPTRLAEELKSSAEFELVDTCYSISVFRRRRRRAYAANFQRHHEYITARQGDRVGLLFPMRQTPAGQLVFEEPPDRGQANAAVCHGDALIDDIGGKTRFTLFAMPKAFAGAFVTIQRNAIESWMQLRPRPEIILLGNAAGVAEFARVNGLRHIPGVMCNEFGTPLVNALFSTAQAAASNEICVYVNADIILMDDFAEAIEGVAGRFDQFLMVGRRWDIDISQEIDFGEEDWRQRLTERVKREGAHHAPTGIDYFAFKKGLWPEIPPMALGRDVWDNWLVREPLLMGKAIIDASGAVTIVHQNHDFSHVAGGKKSASFRIEQQRNIELAGSDRSLAYTSHASWELTAAGITLRPISEFLKTDNLSAALKCIQCSYQQAPDAVREQCEALRRQVTGELRGRLLAAAAIELASGSAKNAARLLLDSLEADGRLATEGLFRQGFQYLSDGDTSQAVRHLEQAAMYCATLPNVYYALATAYARAGDVASAQKACRIELSLRPDNRGAAKLLERIEQAANEYSHSLTG